MSNTDFPLDDGMTDDERAYFQTGGDVSDALAKGAGGPPGGEPEPAATPPPDTSQTNGAPGAAPGGQQPHEEDPGDELVPGQRNPRRVSFAKYQAEIEARQTVERQLQERAIQQAKIEERLSLLQQALQPDPAQQQPDPADERPDPTQDIFAYAAWQERQLNKVVDKVNAYEQQITTGQQEMEEEGRYINAMNNYAGNDPNFLQAYGYLLFNRTAEILAGHYPNATYDQLMNAAMRGQVPEGIRQQMRQEERDLYKNAFSGQRDPAHDIVRFAQMRGYRPPQAAPAGGNGAAAVPAAPQQQQRPGTALAATPAAAAQPNGNGQTPTATQLVEAIRRGQPAATSLSHASGNAAGTELTPQALADMPQDQFEALYNELLARGDNSKLRELFGS